MRQIWQGKVEHGALKLDNRREFTLFLCSLEGKAVDVTVEKHKTTRSTQQNKYLWGVVYEIPARHLGYSAEAIHDLMRYKFLRVEDGRTPGLYTITSTTKLTKDEFSEYIENMKQFWSEFQGLYIPEANEVEV
jgi:hypothetical protein